MTFMSSKRQNTANSICIISTHKTLTYSSPWRNLTKMRSLLFWDTQVSPGPNNTLITTVYRKPTHRDQYLYWDSNHFIRAKYSVFNTLAHRTKVVSHNQKSLQKELDHLRKALQACHFPTWTLNRLQQRFECKHQTNNETSCMDIQLNNTNNTATSSSNNNNNNNISIEALYIHGLGERFKRTYNNKGIKVHFKSTNTIKTLLTAPKDRDNKLKKSGVIYKVKCPHINYPKEYIGECERTLGGQG